MKKAVKRMRNIFVMLLVLTVALSAAAESFGVLDTYAASKKAKKKITLSASALDEYTVVLKWNKIKSPQKGYAVFKNGQCIARLGKKHTMFIDDVDAGSTNVYMIKRWKQKGKGKKKKFKYSKASNSASVTTPADIYTYGSGSTPGGGSGSTSGGQSGGSAGSNTGASTLQAPTNVKCTVDDSAKKITISWDAVPGATGYYLYREYDGKSQRMDVNADRTSVSISSNTEGVLYTYCVRAIKGSDTSEKSSKVSGGLRQRKTVTDFQGTARDIYREPGESSWRYASDSSPVSNMAAIDRTVDGKFSIVLSDYVQKGGVTFDMTEFNKRVSSPEIIFPITMYNGDPDKLKFVMDSQTSIEAVNSYESEGGAYGTPITPVTKYYYVKGGKRVAMTNKYGTLFTTETSGNTTTVKLCVDTWGQVGSGLGIYNDIINFKAMYGDETLAEFSVDTAKDAYPYAGNPKDGMTGRRKLYLDIAQAAMAANGGSKNLDYDLAAIEGYVRDTYTYGQPVEGYGTAISMTCAGGAGVLETWAIYKYGEWGFSGPGSSSYDSHIAYRLNSDPTKKYETQGTGDSDGYFYDEDGNFNPHYH